MADSRHSRRAQLEAILGADPEQRDALRAALDRFGVTSMRVADTGEVTLDDDHDDEAVDLRVAARLDGAECARVMANLAPPGYDAQSVARFIREGNAGWLDAMRHVAAKAEAWWADADTPLATVPSLDPE